MIGRIIMSFLLTVGIGMNASGEVGESMSVEDLLVRYSDVVSRMHHISMHISTRRVPEPSSNPSRFDSEMDLKIYRDNNNVDYFGTFRIFDSNGKCTVSQVECHLFKDGKYYVAAKWPVGGKPVTAQISEGMFQKDLRVYLSTPDFGGAVWGGVDGCSGKDIRELLGEADDIRLSNEIEKVNGMDCYVLSGSTKYGTVTAWIAPERSYNAVKWMVQKRPGDFYNDYHIGDMEESVRIFEAVEFVKIDEVFVMTRGQITQAHHGTEGEQKLIYDCDVSDIELEPDFEALGAFEFRIPDGTPVIMTEHPGVRYVWREGKAVPDVEGLSFDEIDKVFEGGQ